MVKRYAITMEASFIKKRPKDHVRPSRHSRAKAPMTHDLKNTYTNILMRAQIVGFAITINLEN